MKKFLVLASSVLLLLLFNAYRSIADDSDTLWTKSFSGSGYVVNALFAPDDNSIYVTTTERFFELETLSGKIIREIPEVRGIARFMQDKKYFFTYDYKKYSYPEMILIKDYKKDLNFLSLKNYDFDINCTKFGIILGKQYPNYDSSVVIYDAVTDSILFTFKTNENYYRIKFSPDGKYFMTVSADLGVISNPDDNQIIVRLWDALNYKELKVLHTENSNTAITNYINFSPDSKYLAYLNTTQILLYNTETWQLIDTFNLENNSAILCFNFTNDSKYIIYNGYFTDKMEKWDILSKIKIYDFKPQNSYETCNFSNNSLYFTTTGGYSIFLFKDKLTSIKDKFISNIIITPNPVNDIIEISGFEIPIKNLSVYDLKGNIIFTKSNIVTNSSTIKLNLGFLIKGTYILNIKTFNKELSTKFIKE